MAVKPIPNGHHTVTPYLIVSDAKRAIEHYEQAFDAVVTSRMDGPDGKVMHAELKIGDSYIMLADEYPEMGARSPHSIGGSPVAIHLYVPNSDEQVKQACAAGATLVREVKDQFYGDRIGAVQDPFGYQWYLSTHIEDVSPEEMRRRAAAAHGA